MSPAAPRAQNGAGRVLPLWKKALFGLVTTLSLLALLEGVLALVGVQSVLVTRDPFVGFAPLPLFVETSGDDGRPWMTTAQNKLAYFNRQSFPKTKPAGSFRIFCLGGSTTYGHPYDDTTSFAAWLRELLPAALPATRWEVVNAGGISYASYRVAALMEELARYEPDLFIIYSGHNEFLEQRTYADVRDASGLRLRLTAALARTRTYALMERIVRAPPAAPVDQLAGEVDALLDHTVGPSSYRRDDALRDQVLRHYEFNLERMISLAHSAGADVVLVTPAANLKDCSPFKSQHRDGLPPAEQQRFADHLERGRRLDREGDAAGALTAYQAAVAIDDRFAEAHYRAGRVLLSLDRPVEAAAAFRRALDEDVCSIRATTAICEIVRRVGRARGAPVVDFAALLQNETLREQAHTVPGKEHFLDHVHPTIDATRLLAIAIARDLARQGIIDSAAAWSDGQLAEAAARIESRIDASSHAVALRTLAKVLNGAGKHEEAGPLALQALETLPDDPESLVLGAAYLKAGGHVEQAVEHYRRALRQAPLYVEAHRLLGAALVELRRHDEAFESFHKLTQLTPDDAHAWHMCGAVRAEQGKYAESLEYYSSALKLAPDDPHLHYNFGLAHARLGRRDEATVHLRRALELNPRDADARRELQALGTPAPVEEGRPAAERKAVFER